MDGVEGSPNNETESKLPDNGMGTAALVLGILSAIQCIPILGGILAIVFGRIGMQKAAAGQATNGDQARLGMILGIVGICISVAVAILIGVLIAIGVIATETTSTM